ncbi:hypothetical protein B0H12DRAFT_1136112, partial [Mycena haematopus]
MPDILGTITGILQLVNTALKAREYIKDFSNAPAEQAKLFTEMEDLKPLLAELQNRVSASQSTSTLLQITLPLTRFNTTLERFTAKFRPADDQWSKFSKQLTWTLWNKKEAKEYVNEFEGIKSLITVWLAVDISDVGHQQNDLLATVAQHVHAQQVRFSAAEHNEISEWLTSLNFFQRQSDIFSVRQSGTGEWLLSDPQFKDWESNSGKSLWCRGMPGGGKTVLSSVVVNHLEAHLRTDLIGVACIYLNHKETGAHTVANLIASLCKQLLVDKPIPSTVSDMYLRHFSRGTRPSLDEILEALRSIMAKYDKIYFVVDALDEYPEDERNVLLEYLSTITLGPPIINLLMTSRPNITLTPFFSDVILLEIRAVDDDIRQYVETHIKKSSRLSRHVQSRPELRDEISSKIIKNVQGMFMLAKLHMNSLATKNTVSAVRETLEQLPKDLNHAFDSTIERISQQNTDDKEVARLALIWVAYSKRPLTVPELLEALAIEPGATTLDVDNLLDIDIVLSVCGGLVIVNDTSSAVRLVHYTAQHYLDSIRTVHFPDADTIIASRCFTYLSFKELPTIKHPIRVGSTPLTIPEHPFLRYSQYCFQHAANASGLYLLDQIQNSVWDSFKVSPWTYRQWSSSLLWISAASNLVAIAEHLLAKETFAKNALNSPLRAALHFGHAEMVELLCKFGPDLDCVNPGEKYGTLLQVAALEDNEPKARLLVEMGAGVDALGGYFGTALQASADRGGTSMVQLLIELGADVNVQSGHYGTALQAAVFSAHTPAVQILLEKGADPNTQAGAAQKAASGIEGLGSALQTASFKGHEPLVKLLIDNGADVNSQGGHYGTALQAASAMGYESIVQVLLDRGANINAQGGRFGTALHAASDLGREAVVRLLLEKGAKVNLRVGDHGTALQKASARKREAVVRFLVEKGADVNAPGGRFGSALEAASYSGQESIVRFLVKMGADVDPQGEHFVLALNAASKKGHREVVHFLMDA